VPEAANARVTLQRLDVGCLKALRAALRLEADLLVFHQRFESVTRNFRKVREQVCASGIRGDESKALAFVEPLDRAGFHDEALKIKKYVPARYGDGEASRGRNGTANSAQMADM